MCLGIPGQVVELVEDNAHLAKVDVAGVRRRSTSACSRTRVCVRATGC